MSDSALWQHAPLYCTTLLFVEAAASPTASKAPVHIRSWGCLWCPSGRGWSGPSKRVWIIQSILFSLDHSYEIAAKVNMTTEDIQASTNCGSMHAWLMSGLPQVHVSSCLSVERCFCRTVFSSITPVDNVDANVLKTPKHVFLKSPAVDAVVVAVLSLTWSGHRG